MGETLHTLGIYWPKLIAQIINFGIIIFVLWRFAYKPILALLEQRSQKIADSMAKAEQVQRDAAAAEEQRKKVLAEANEKATKMIEEVKASADAVSQKKIQEAVAQAEALIKKAEEASARDREQMMNDLRAEMGRLVVDTTAKVVGKTLTPEDQKRLQQEAVANIS